MIVVNFTPYYTPDPRIRGVDSMPPLIRITESLVNINAAVWAASSSVEIAAVALKTPTIASAGIATVACIAAAASIAIVVVQISNIADAIRSGSDLTSESIQKANEALDVLAEPLSNLVELADKLIQGNEHMSGFHELLETIKDALEVFERSRNPLERVAAFTEIVSAVEHLFSAPLKQNPPQPTTEQAPTTSPPTREPIDLRDGTTYPHGDLAGEPYHDPGTAHA